MNFKQSLILLFVGIMSAIAVSDIDQYDADILKEMLRTQVECPVQFSNYIQNCTAILNIDLEICSQEEDAAKTKLQKQSLENRQKIASTTDQSCKAVSDCENDSGDDGDIFGCYAQRGSQTATSMSNMYYEANNMQNNYNKQLQEITSTKGACTLNCSQTINDRTAEAMLELNACLANGIWTIYQEIPVVAEPTQAPEPTNAPQPTEAPVVTDKPESSENSNENEETDVVTDAATNSEV